MEIDAGPGTIRDLTNVSEYEAAPFPDFLQAIMDMGGLRGYAEERLRQRAGAETR